MSKRGAFSAKMVCKRVRGWTSGRSISVLNFDKYLSRSFAEFQGQESFVSSHTGADLLRKWHQIVLWGSKSAKSLENRFINVIILFILAESCGGILKDPSGEITSPNYPNNYPDDATCTWKISPEKTHVNLTIEDFKVSAQQPDVSCALLCGREIIIT